MNPTNPINTNGFTLLEILLAMFILAVVISLIFASYIGTFRTIDETESQAEVYQMARITLERMREDLESAYILTQPATPGSGQQALNPKGFVGEDKEIMGKEADTLSFFSRAHLVFDDDDKDAGLTEIVYYTEENEEGDSLVLYRSDTPEFEEPPGKGAGGLILCEDLLSVNVTYYDENGDVYDDWDSIEGQFKDKLPKMVSIVLEFVDKLHPEAPLKFMTGVALPISRWQYGTTS
jgi:general secretion pathway protein J